MSARGDQQDSSAKGGKGRTGAIVEAQLAVRNVEEELEVVARQSTMLAHDLGDPVEVLGSDVAQSFDVVDLTSDDLRTGGELVQLGQQEKRSRETCVDADLLKRLDGLVLALLQRLDGTLLRRRLGLGHRRLVERLVRARTAEQSSSERVLDRVLPIAHQLSCPAPERARTHLGHREPLAALSTHRDRPRDPVVVPPHLWTLGLPCQLERLARIEFGPLRRPPSHHHLGLRAVPPAPATPAAGHRSSVVTAGRARRRGPGSGGVQSSRGSWWLLLLLLLLLLLGVVARYLTCNALLLRGLLARSAT